MRKALIMLCFTLSACGPLHDVPEDMSYVGLKYNFGPFVGVGNYKKYYGNMIDVTVVSNFNYQKYVIDSNLSPDAFAYPCDSRGDEKFEYAISAIYRYDRGYIKITDGKVFNEKPPYEYHVFIPEHNFYNRRLKEDDPYFKNKDLNLVMDFDLRADPRDICLRFGYSSLNYRESSNTVRIPKEELLKLFALGDGH